MTRRGGDCRGNTEDRRKRKEYLVAHYRADVDVVTDVLGDIVRGPDGQPVTVPLGEGVPACRCYRCGCLLTVRTCTADRRVLGADGGTYFDVMNLRPACARDNSSTGGAIGAARRAARKAIAS